MEIPLRDLFFYGKREINAYLGVWRAMSGKLKTDLHLKCFHSLNQKGN